MSALVRFTVRKKERFVYTGKLDAIGNQEADWYLRILKKQQELNYLICIIFSHFRRLVTTFLGNRASSCSINSMSHRAVAQGGFNEPSPYNQSIKTTIKKIL